MGLSAILHGYGQGGWPVEAESAADARVWHRGAIAVMSHYTVLKTRMTDIKALVQALADMDLKQVEVYATAQRLVGIGGDAREQTAEVIIRRKHLGWLSNDFGFKRGSDGSFEAIISDYDQRWCTQDWLDRLLQRYAYHVARAKLEEKGFALVSEKAQGTGQIHLVLRRMA
jgi:hypothetical protein